MIKSSVLWAWKMGAPLFTGIAAVCIALIPAGIGDAICWRFGWDLIVGAFVPYFGVVGLIILYVIGDGILTHKRS